MKKIILATLAIALLFTCNKNKKPGHVNEGEFVRKGQRLATVKTTEINVQLYQEKLGYANAKRDYDIINNHFIDSGATLEELQNIDTALENPEGTVDMVSSNGESASIISSTEAFVTKIIGNVGEIVNPGSRVIAINELSPKSGWLFKINVSDKECSHNKVEQKAIVELDDFRQKKICAFVNRKSQAVIQSAAHLKLK